MSSQKFTTTPPTMSSYTLPSLCDVEKAASLVAQRVAVTPVKVSSSMSYIATQNARRNGGRLARNCNTRLYLKCENLQTTGSFKFRGSSHFIARLQDDELANGVVAYSTGTFACFLSEFQLIYLQEIMPKLLPTPLKSRLASAI